MTIKVSFEPKVKVSKASSTFVHNNLIVTQCNPSRTKTRDEGMTLLPCGFRPGPFDVICARGREATKHAGNENFLSIVKSFITQYSQATSRIKKSIIVTRIVDKVREQSPNGGFVKEERGDWYEVGEHLAREKVGQTFRNLLHGQYKSSAVSKKRRRQRIETKMQEDVEAVLLANEIASRRMKEISHTIETEGPETSDASLTVLLTQVNCDLLQSFKTDKAVQQLFRDQAAMQLRQRC